MVIWEEPDLSRTSRKIRVLLRLRREPSKNLVKPWDASVLEDPIQLSASCSGKTRLWTYLKSLTRDKDRRVANKILLLQQLKKAGVWLVDASIIGINERDPNLKSGIVEVSWDAYTGPLIERLDPRPRSIIVIGYGVAKTLGSRLKRLNIPTHEIPQPQGWRKPGYVKFYQECFDICSKFA